MSSSTSWPLAARSALIALALFTPFRANAHVNQIAEQPPATPAAVPPGDLKPEPAPTAASNGESPAATAPVDLEEAQREAQKKRKVRLAVIAGGLVAVTGIALIILTILGGSATRRRLRRRPFKYNSAQPEPLRADRFDDPDADEERPAAQDPELPVDPHHSGDAAS